MVGDGAKPQSNEAVIKYDDYNKLLAITGVGMLELWFNYEKI